MKKPETMWISMDETTRKEFSVGVGRNNPPQILTTDHSLIVNDEETLTVFRSDGTTIVRRPGQAMEAHYPRRSLQINNIDLADYQTRQMDLGNDTLGVWLTFKSGGRCVFVQSKDGRIRHFSSRGLFVSFEKDVIEILGSYPPSDGVQ